MDYSSPRIASAKKSSDARRISFDLEPEVHEIAIENYQEGLPKRIYRDPNKHYVFWKIDDLTDDQSKSDNTLGSVRARAKAIIMDRCGLHRFVDEVRIIIGPKFDMLIKLDNDHEDLVFTEELVEHKVGKSLKKSKDMMCISLPVQAKDRRFILDSGSGHDLISARKAERMNLKQRTCDPIMFHTANGSTATQTEAEIDLGTFDMTSHAYVLDDTPSVMSLGKRCMEEDTPLYGPLARCLSWLRKMENASIWQSTTTFPMLTSEHTSALHMNAIMHRRSMTYWYILKMISVNSMTLTM